MEERQARQKPTLNTDPRNPLCAENLSSQPEHLQKLLEDYRQCTAKFSLIYLVEKICQLEDIAISFFTDEGGSLSLDRHKVHLYIPRGAIPKGDVKPVYIYVSPDALKLDSRSDNPDNIFASRIRCGPPGVKFLDSLVASFPHHSQELASYSFDGSSQTTHEADGADIEEETVVLFIKEFTKEPLVSHIDDYSSTIDQIAKISQDTMEKAYMRDVFGEKVEGCYLPEKSLHELCSLLDSNRDGRPYWIQLGEHLFGANSSQILTACRASRNRESPTRTILKVYFSHYRRHGHSDADAVAHLTKVLKKLHCEEAVKIIQKAQTLSDADDRLLRMIPRQLGPEWERLATSHDFPAAEISHFKANYPGHVESQIFDMLNTWRQKQPTSVDPTAELHRALTEVGRVDLAKELIDVDSASTTSSSLGYCQQQVVQHYKDTTSTISAHPLDPTGIVGTDEFFITFSLNRK